MIVKTRNSEYLVEEFPGPRFRVTKTYCLLDGKHGSVDVGDSFESDEITIKVGEKMVMNKNFIVLKSSWATHDTEDKTKGYLPYFYSTPVVEIRY